MSHPPDAEGPINNKGEDIGLQPDQVLVADVKTGKVKFRLDPRFQPLKPNERPDPKRDAPKVWSTEFSHDSKYLAACTGDGVVTVWEMGQREAIAVFRSVAPYSVFDGEDRLSWVGDHDSLIVPGAVLRGFFRCDIQRKEMQPIFAKADPNRAAPKVKQAAKRPPGDPKVLVATSGPYDDRAFAISRNGRHLVKVSHDFSGDGIRNIFVSRLPLDQTGGVIAGLKRDRAWSLRFSPDSERLAIGTARGNVFVYRTGDIQDAAHRGVLLETGLVANVPSPEQPAGNDLEKIGVTVSGSPMTIVDCHSANRMSDAMFKVVGRFPQLEKLYAQKTKLTDAGLKELRGLKNQKHLNLNKIEISDAGLNELSELTNLKRLEVMGTNVTDVGLKELRGMKKLEILHLDQTRITDAGLKELRDLKGLRQLGISFNDTITDRGLKEIRDFKIFESIGLSTTNGTDTGVNQLRAARPKLMISGGP